MTPANRSTTSLDTSNVTTQRVGDGCTKDDIVIHQGATAPLPNGIPTYTVQVLNVCAEKTNVGCELGQIHYELWLVQLRPTSQSACLSPASLRWLLGKWWPAFPIGLISIVPICQLIPVPANRLVSILRVEIDIYGLVLSIPFITNLWYLLCVYKGDIYLLT